MSEKRNPKPKDLVNLVLADTKANRSLPTGLIHPAQITKVRSNGTVDLVFDHPAHGEGVEIHSSPCDPEGKQPDSWHFPIEEDAPAKQQPAK